MNIPRNDSTTTAPQGVKISPSAGILDAADLSKEYNQRITTVLEHHGKLYVGSWEYSFVGQYGINYV